MCEMHLFVELVARFKTTVAFSKRYGKDPLVLAAQEEWRKKLWRITTQMRSRGVHGEAGEVARAP